MNEKSLKNFENLSWNKVKLARDKNRVTSLELINYLFTNFIELHGDRLYADDKAIVGGIGFLGEMPVTVIGTQKGKDISENIKRNFGMAHPEGYRKALRLMKQAEKFNRPIICFIDTPGAYCGIGAEERGQGEAIARNLMEMSRLCVPIISIIIGEGGSGGALALAVSDQVWMLENTIYSILSPEGFASILWKDGTRAKEASEIMKITSDDLKKFNIIDKIIEEPNWESINEKNKFIENLGESLKIHINKLFKLNENIILEKRYNRFRMIGKYNNRI